MFLVRRRADSMQAHRGAFVATPTAELSNQEETLLGDFLDWSLDTSCSDPLRAPVSTMEVQMELPLDCADRQTHCCLLSSDDTSLCEEDEQEPPTGGSKPWTRHLSSSSTSSSSSSCGFCTDRHSSGYSSIQSFPSPTGSSALVSPQNPPGVPSQRIRRQVKRKNTAAHSAGEAEQEDDAANLAFLSFWSTGSLNASLPGCPPGALWINGCWWSQKAPFQSFKHKISTKVMFFLSHNAFHFSSWWQERVCCWQAARFNALNVFESLELVGVFLSLVYGVLRLWKYLKPRLFTVSPECFVCNIFN